MFIGKKVGIIAFSALILVLMVTGCGKKEQKTAEDVIEEEPVAEEMPAEPMKVDVPSDVKSDIRPSEEELTEIYRTFFGEEFHLPSNVKGEAYKDDELFMTVASDNGAMLISLNLPDAGSVMFYEDSTDSYLYTMDPEGKTEYYHSGYIEETDSGFVRTDQTFAFGGYLGEAEYDGTTYDRVALVDTSGNGSDSSYDAYMDTQTNKLRVIVLYDMSGGYRVEYKKPAAGEVSSYAPAELQPTELEPLEMGEMLTGKLFGAIASLMTSFETEQGEEDILNEEASYSYPDKTKTDEIKVAGYGYISEHNTYSIYGIKDKEVYTVYDKAVFEAIRDLYDNNSSMEELKIYAEHGKNDNGDDVIISVKG